MRKALAIFLGLIAVLVAGMFPLGSYVLSERDQVKYEETVLKGTAEQAKDITVAVQGQMNHHNYWDSVYTIGEGEDTLTEYTYYATYHQEKYTPGKGYGIQFDGYPNFGGSGGGMESIFDRIGFLEAYKALESQTPAGMTASISFPVSEYTKYYPVWFSVSVDAFRYDYSDSYLGRAAGQGAPKNDKELANRVFSEFFRIPVSETEMYTITITKNASGTVTAVQGEPGAWQTEHESAYENGESMTLHGSTNSEDYFIWETVSCWDDGNLYFTFVPYTQKGQEINTDLIPGGYGIYRVPYYADESGEYHLDAQKLALWYPLPKESVKEELELELDAEGNLLVLTGTEKEITFTVLGKEKGDCLQKLTIERPEEKAFFIRYRDENFIVGMFETEYVLVVEYTPGEGYRNCFLAKVEENSLIAQTARNYRWEGDCDWNGERLVYATYGLAGIEEVGGWPGRMYDTDFSVAIYDATGEIYLAEYRSGLHTEQERNPLAHEAYHTNDRCMNSSVLEVNWQK